MNRRSAAFVAPKAVSDLKRCSLWRSSKSSLTVDGALRTKTRADPAAPEPVEQEVRQQERPEDVRREHRLEAVVGDRPLRGVDGCAVDEDVERRVSLGYCACEVPHGPQVGQVAHEQLDPLVLGRRDDREPRLLPANGIAGDDPDGRARGRQRAGERPPDS